MAKLTNYIPEPKQEYDVENQRQIIESMTTMKQQLNFSFQEDLKMNKIHLITFIMTIQYKNQDLNNRIQLNNCFTYPTSAIAIVKSIYCANNDASSAILVNMNFVDSSDSSTEYEFFRDDVAAKTTSKCFTSRLEFRSRGCYNRTSSYRQ